MPTFQPILQQQGGASTYIRPGVEDRSKATSIQATTGLIGAVAQEGLAIHQGYQEASLEKDIESEISSYFAKNKQYEQGLEAGKEAGAYQIERESLFDIADKEGVPVDEITSVEKKLNDRLSTYKTAMEQGKMSIDELEARILSVTREAINRNPGLTDVLLKRADRVLELSGASSYIKAAKQAEVDAAKQQAEMLKNIRELADQHNIPYNPFNPDYNAITQQVNEIKVQKQAADAIKRTAEGTAALRKEEGISFVQQFGGKAILGDLDEFRAQATALWQNSGAKDYAAISYQIDTLSKSLSDKWYAAAARAQISNEPVVQDMIKRQEASLKAVVDRMRTLKSGEDFVKVLDNEVKALQLTQQKGMYENYNVEALNMVAKVASIAPDLLKSWAVGTGKYDVQAITQTLGSLVQGFMSPQAINSMTSTNASPSKVDAVNVLGTMLKGNEITGAGKLLESFNKGYSQIPDEAGKFKFLEHSVRELGNVSYTENMKNIPVDGVQNGMNLVATYMNQVVPSMISGLNSAFAEIPGETSVSLDVLPDGRLTLTSDNKELQDKVTKKYIIRINESLSAMANLHGKSTKEVAPLFYSTYMKQIPELAQDKDIAKRSGASGKY